jgi:preprotein translocase subunit SecA
MDPRIEYKREALGMFESMNLSIRDDVTDLIFKLQVGEEVERKNIWHPDHYVHQEVAGLEKMQESPAAVSMQSSSVNSEAPVERKIETIKVGVKVGRNQPCPCGSGRKYKQCCGGRVS